MRVLELHPFYCPCWLHTVYLYMYFTSPSTWYKFYKLVFYINANHDLYFQITLCSGWICSKKGNGSKNNRKYQLFDGPCSTRRSRIGPCTGFAKSYLEFHGTDRGSKFVCHVLCDIRKMLHENPFVAETHSYLITLVYHFEHQKV